MKPLSIVLLLCSAACSTIVLRADIQTQEKDQVKFAGALGRVMGIFGGKVMREGVTDTIAVKGNRKMTVNDTTGTLIDLDDEKVYQLDMKAKTYKVLTFDDVRRQFEQAEQRAKKTEEKPQAVTEPEPAKDPDAKQIQIDFDLKDTGEKKKINGYDCHEVVMTIAVHEKDKTLEQSGGMVLTTHEWLAPDVPSTREIADFDRRYDEKLHGPIYAAMPSADQMAAAAAMYPMLAPALGRLNTESISNVNMEGTPVLISMVTESVASPEQQQQQEEQEKAQQKDSSGGVPTSVGGLIGGFGRRALAKRDQKQKQQEDTTPGRATVMTINHELLKAATNVSAADVAIPSGFKQKN